MQTFCIYLVCCFVLISTFTPLVKALLLIFSFGKVEGFRKVELREEGGVTDTDTETQRGGSDVLKMAASFKFK